MVASQSVARLEITLPANHPAETIVNGSVAIPGWNVSVDGHSRARGTAFGAIQTVTVRLGEHDAVLTYEASWFKTGRAISLLPVLTCCFLAFGGGGLNRRRRSMRPATEPVDS